MRIWTVGYAFIIFFEHAKMKIKGFQVSNYKCFDEGNWTPLAEGITVVTGTNSAGKTALLEALSLTLRGNPHRSIKRKASERSPSVVELICEVPRAELAELSDRGHQVLLPAPVPSDQLLQQMGMPVNPTARYLTPEQQNDFAKRVCERESFELRLTRNIAPYGAYSDRATLVELENLRQAQRDNGEREYLRFTLRNGQFNPSGSVWSAGPVDLFPGLADLIESRIYRFSPERFSTGASLYGDNRVLSTNAGNLPEVLNTLQSHPTRFRDFNRLVSRVLPQVKWVDTRPRNPNNEIWIWPEDRESGRDDLAIPLVDCGTGVGHVLAILYVLFTSESEQTILIDEPQSFLHPGAARRLMDVLSEFPKHQLVIATHSPAIISAVAVQQVLSVSTNGDAKVVSVEWENTTHKAALLNELGARLADVYGADDILWVEGPTEEECFPKILNQLAPGILSGTAILAVRKTGDLEGKDAERVFEIYGSLSTSGSLLPPTIAFLFDRECWSTQKLTELTTRSKGLLRTTERRTFENYLLNADGIASVINNADLSRSTPVTGEAVAVFLQKAATDLKYSCKGTPEGMDESHFFDAPEALKDLFNELTETRVSYLKTTHSVALCEWILENDPEFLQPVTVILKNALSRNADAKNLTH